VKCLLLTHKPPETAGTPEFKAEPTSKMRLPDMPLPVFIGDFSEWITFRRRFQTLITQNSTLNDVEQLYYLRASLRDEALSLQSTNDTFASLWSALVERFEVKRVIAGNHINQLFVLRKAKTQAKKLKIKPK
jgi:hypothetical protein